MDELIRTTEKALNVKKREDMHIVIVGHVDHGKSTVIGRLLADNNMLPEGKIEQIKEKCRRNSKPFEYAFLLDALKDEQSQGITIDTARTFFTTEKRNYIILDAPGHVEFLKNMVTGAARAEAALMVVDANEGVMENSKRHGYLLSMLGVKQIAVLINKMDAVGYSKERFDDIKTEYGAFLQSIGITASSFIPVSGMQGDNIVNRGAKNMSWYCGVTVMDQLEAFDSKGDNSKLPLRIPVQGVYKFTGNNDDRRIIAGTVETGVLNVGDEITFYPSGKTTVAKTIEMYNADVQTSAEAGSATGFTMSQQIYAMRGDIAVKSNEPQPKVSNGIIANVFWLGKEPLVKGKSYTVKLGTAKVKARIESVNKVLDASTLNNIQKSEIARNEVGECSISFERQIAFDIVDENPITSRFVLIDDYEICGGGIVTAEKAIGGGNITRDDALITRDERVLASKQCGHVLWLTGLSGSGKSTISGALERVLNSMGYSCYRLDGDNLRFGLNKDCDFTDRGRDENLRRAAEVARLFADAGLITICTFISPKGEQRANARACVGELGFSQVYVKASVEECARRDPKGLYKKAFEGSIKGFTGVDSPYDEPVDADIVIDTEETSVDGAVDMILNYLSDNGIIY